MCFTTQKLVNLTSRHLSVPDLLCSNCPNYGNQCPKNMFCNKLEDIKQINVEYQYNNLVNAFFTVYKAASQEDWSTLMYEKMGKLILY